MVLWKLLIMETEITCSWLSGTLNGKSTMQRAVQRKPFLLRLSQCVILHKPLEMIQFLLWGTIYWCLLMWLLACRFMSYTGHSLCVFLGVEHLQFSLGSDSSSCRIMSHDLSTAEKQRALWIYFSLLIYCANNVLMFCRVFHTVCDRVCTGTSSR